VPPNARARDFLREHATSTVKKNPTAFTVLQIKNNLSHPSIKGIQTAVHLPRPEIKIPAKMVAERCGKKVDWNPEGRSFGPLPSWSDALAAAFHSISKMLWVG
jgi:hypothetical protein